MLGAAANDRGEGSGEGRAKPGRVRVHVVARTARMIGETGIDSVGGTPAKNLTVMWLANRLETYLSNHTSALAGYRCGTAFP